MHERAHAVVNQLAECIDRDGVATLGPGLGCLQGLEKVPCRIWGIRLEQIKNISVQSKNDGNWPETSCSRRLGHIPQMGDTMRPETGLQQAPSPLVSILFRIFSAMHCGAVLLDAAKRILRQNDQAQKHLGEALSTKQGRLCATDRGCDTDSG